MPGAAPGIEEKHKQVFRVNEIELVIANGNAAL